MRLLLAFLAAVMLGTPAAASDAPSAQWVTAFESSPATYDDQFFRIPADVPPPYAYLVNKKPIVGTVRVRLAVSASGTAVQVRFSNELGTKPLQIGGASIGRAAAGDVAVRGSLRRLTFGGKTAITIAPGTPALSDPIDFKVEAMEELLVSTFLPEPTPRWPLGGWKMALTAQEAVMADSLPGSETIDSRPVVTGVLVKNKNRHRVIVALGDSITDSSRNTGEPRGWVHTLSMRLARGQAGSSAPVAVSAGIGGNRLIADGWGPAMLARADRDVFAKPGLSYVILLAGINDIGFSGIPINGNPPALNVDALLQGYAQLAARAHAKGIKIFGATLTPFKGAAYFTDEKEQQRQRVNQWIRTSQLFDGVIDFDRAIRDPLAPLTIKKEYDSGDHLHPGPAGYVAMGTAVDLNLFR